VAASDDPVFFESAAAFRAWLAANHSSAGELQVGFRKKATGRPTLTWPESVDQALCFGWIDGIRRSLGADAYTIRFTPRRAGSNWSAVNLARVEELTRLGLMEPAGLRAYEGRDEAKARQYSYERATAALEPALEARLRACEPAWAFWESQPAGYRRIAAHFVMSARRADTRDRRLAMLIDDSAAGRRLAAVTLRPAGGSASTA
jgi:uncharacterized protein YdeI (YjbR/CyaY-like superfamily)